jgi:2-dehydro-3-deoxyphosphogluconate aldolase/(4S)-4-hydroxy-2-oxoglutarate aldolase
MAELNPPMTTRKEVDMSKTAVLERIRAEGLLAVLRGPDPATTVKMVEALLEGGVVGIEITFTTPDALDVVEKLEREFGEDILLGMGTLTHVKHAGQAVEAGASFIVSPSCKPELGQAMVDTELAVMIGALTPTEIQTAHEMGADVVKVFPGSLVGPGYFKAIHGPYPQIRLMPTGGVSADNVVEWLQAGAFAVGAGSNLCPKQLALEGRFADITRIAKAFVSEVRKAQGRVQGEPAGR